MQEVEYAAAMVKRIVTKPRQFVVKTASPVNVDIAD